MHASLACFDTIAWPSSPIVGLGSFTNRAAMTRVRMSPGTVFVMAFIISSPGGMHSVKVVGKKPYLDCIPARYADTNEASIQFLSSSSFNNRELLIISSASTNIFPNSAHTRRFGSECSYNLAALVSCNALSSNCSNRAVIEFSAVFRESSRMHLLHLHSKSQYLHMAWRCR